MDLIEATINALQGKLEEKPNKDNAEINAKILEPNANKTDLQRNGYNVERADGFTAVKRADREKDFREVDVFDDGAVVALGDKDIKSIANKEAFDAKSFLDTDRKKPYEEPSKVSKFKMNKDTIAQADEEIGKAEISKEEHPEDAEILDNNVIEPWRKLKDKADAENKAMLNKKTEDKVEKNYKSYYFEVGVEDAEGLDRPVPYFEIPYKTMDENVGMCQTFSEAFDYVNNYINSGVNRTYGIIVEVNVSEENYNSIYSGWSDAYDYYNMKEGKLRYSAYKDENGKYVVAFDDTNDIALGECKQRKTLGEHIVVEDKECLKEKTLTWEDIMTNAEGTTFGHQSLKVKDTARDNVEKLLVKAGIDIDSVESVEDEIEKYCKDNNIKFDTHGNLVTECEKVIESIKVGDKIKIVDYNNHPDEDLLDWADEQSTDIFEVSEVDNDSKVFYIKDCEYGIPFDSDDYITVKDKVTEDVVSFDEAFYAKICKAYVNTANLEWVTTNPENDSVVHGYFANDDVAEKYDYGAKVTPKNFKDVAYEGHTEEEIENGDVEWYDYDTWEDFYEDYVKGEILYDIDDIGTYPGGTTEPFGDWDFYISKEDLIKLGLWNEDEKVTESAVSDYTLSEIKKVLDSEETEYNYTLKISNGEAGVSTKTLDIDKSDLQAIYDALSKNKVTENKKLQEVDDEQLIDVETELNDMKDNTDKLYDSWVSISNGIREILDAQFEDNANISYCIRWLSQALDDITSDWANVKTDLINNLDESKKVTAGKLEEEEKYYDLTIKYTDGSNGGGRMTAEGAGKMLTGEIYHIDTIKVGNNNGLVNNELVTETVQDDTNEVLSPESDIN